MEDSQGTSKLISLRNIEADERIITTINEVGKLTSLQQLSAFRVSMDRGRRLEELSDLTQLRGSLRITNLENVELEIGDCPNLMPLPKELLLQMS
ncbi:NB-ARC domain [Musa troglodytarum]|uniref:NB-ARC domain n=1 Tax=Musa troglodytarum TaxID=320322 RepID=A0A9E7L514_9LILI|nr:NB-ARC domain [Musa troglodytarum]